MAKITKISVAQDLLEVQVASELGIGAVAKGSGSGSRYVLTYEVAVETADLEHRTVGAYEWADGTQSWFRVEVATTQVEAQASVDFASVAAQSKVNNLAVEFDIDLRGATDAVVKALPRPSDLGGEFSPQAFKELVASTGDALDALAKDFATPANLRNSRRPVRRLPDEDEEIAQARAVHYAVVSLARMASLETAVRKRPETVDPFDIRRTYEQFWPDVRDKSLPPPRVRRAAKDWLDVVS